MTEQDIRDRITQLRIERRLSEYELSLKLGQSKGYIQGISSGRSMPSMKMMMNICEFFGIEMSEFFETKMPTLATRKLRDELVGLPDEDVELITHVVKKMKK